ncbi:acetyl-CoA carboxylase biotin carboxyl carrier protein [Aquibacillus sediminis]|uniref:acetyl-CoA carboxylase biotin carboxyl carrier protein n=1 Tax=Aquibacillus sediminis TaxID=2574734 RepID=UPI001109B76B|nr:acetyl-CoA carboxylase biotin carboxyl carrier protein [Aquibacillus sediminis]
MLKIQEIHELIEKIDESSIDEFSYETNGTKIAIKKQKGETVTTQAPVQVAQHPVVQQEPVAKQSESPAVEQNQSVQQEADYDHEVVSPMVGTFYSAPSPDKEDYVHVGDKVTTDTVVCIVEAMKLFNEIEADVSGEIVEILVENGELVEYGQPLFRVKA